MRLYLMKPATKSKDNDIMMDNHNFKDYLRMLRIGDWIRFYPIAPLAGALLAGGEPYQMALVTASYLGIIAYAFAVNNYFDADIDRLNPEKVHSGKNPMARGSISNRGAAIEMLILCTGAIVLSVQTGVGSLTGPILVIINIALFTAYSAPPLRLKERPVLDILTHGLMFGAVPVLSGAYLVSMEATPTIQTISVLAFLVGCEALVAHQVIDYDLDIGSTMTTVLSVGKWRGIILLVALAALSVIFLLIASSALQLSGWAIAAIIWYLMAYPAYTCRGLYRDIRSSAIPE